MNTPEFTAEASLYKTQHSYRATARFSNTGSRYDPTIYLSNYTPAYTPEEGWPYKPGYGPRGPLNLDLQRLPCELECSFKRDVCVGRIGEMMASEEVTRQLTYCEINYQLCLAQCHCPDLPCPGYVDGRLTVKCCNTQDPHWPEHCCIDQWGSPHCCLNHYGLGGCYYWGCDLGGLGG
jgi:hypothetical protein